MKKLIVVLTLAMMISGSVLSASAEEVSVTEETIAVEQIDGSSGTIVPVADQIIVKFRIYQGKKQYRHWNQTHGYWVEPDWITYG
jgi:uncharacterized membrane protein